MGDPGATVVATGSDVDGSELPGVAVEPVVVEERDDARAVVGTDPSRPGVGPLDTSVSGLLIGLPAIQAPRVMKASATAMMTSRQRPKSVMTAPR